ncbi:hypothetical protein [Vibrio sp. Hep-1b-8]|uniref:hypothetical protein n=1 Tax=unclassified Vibrio TaxID=2614977 RepID=UPI001485F18C|nr:hypothetical protein [Vibrio sp. Hep-1b-8]
MDFTEKLRLRGKAEEDIYFAKLDLELIKAMHEREAVEKNREQSEAECELISNATTNK